MRARLVAVGLACSLAGVGAPALAQGPAGTLEKIKQTKTISLGHRESSVPFSYYDDKQQVGRLLARAHAEGGRRGQEGAEAAELR